MRKQQETAEFRVTYALRAGIEGTHSQGVRTLGLRQSRYIGLQKASLQHALIAAAMNLLRIDNFITGGKMEQTRISHFAALAPKKIASFCSHQFANGINTWHGVQQRSGCRYVVAASLQRSALPLSMRTGRDVLSPNVVYGYALLVTARSRLGMCLLYVLLNSNVHHAV